jgi:hypothetical protein
MAINIRYGGLNMDYEFVVDMNIIREELAELEHEQWAHWTEYMLNNLTQENIKRWNHQIKTPYKKLTLIELESDRVWADKVLNIFMKYKRRHFCD